MLVRFLKSWRNYNRGETAGFVDHVADELVAGGWAEQVEDNATEAAALDGHAPKGRAGRKVSAADLPEQGTGG